jgi:NAD+ kinase
MEIRRVTIIANADKPEALSLIREMQAVLDRAEVGIVCEERVGRALRLPWGTAQDLASSDLCISLGGDGTLIHAARILQGNPVPVLGVNLGFLGFLTEIPVSYALPMLQETLAGDYLVEPRRKLRVRLLRTTESASEITSERFPESILDTEALNDVVINKGTLSRIADFEASIDGTIITSYKADGIIVSTPTGSTGYSLSASGPIVHPTIQAIIITPICPHTLTQRPIVVPDHQTITLRLVNTKADIYLTLDGQEGMALQANDRVEIGPSPNPFLLIKNRSLDYFTMLRTKLRWGER